MNIYLLHYNNYYNRIIKKLGTLQEYIDGNYVVGEYYDINFNPNDGVVANLVVDHEGETPDYLLAVDEYNEIVSRWFVIEAVRTRGGQYQLTLYRDLIADYKEEVMNSTAYIEKGWIVDDSDPAIYNLENFTVNEIKTEEMELRDTSTCAWIVGYYDKKALPKDLTGPVVVDVSELPYEQLTGELNSYAYHQYFTEDFIGPYDISTAKIRTKFGLQTGQTDSTKAYAGYIDYFYSGNTNAMQSTDYIYEPMKINLELSKADTSLANIASGWKSAMNKMMSASQWFSSSNAYLPKTTDEQLKNFLEQNNKLVRTYTGEFYRIKVKPKSTATLSSAVSAGSLYNQLKQVASTATAQNYKYLSKKLFTTSPGTSTFVISATAQLYDMTYERVKQYEATFDLSNGEIGVIPTETTPYNIFAIPYGSVEVYSGSGYDQVLFDGGDAVSALALASAIQRKLGEFLYDIQLLPYCPIPEIINQGDDTIHVTSEKMVSFVTDAEERVYNIIFNVPSPSFEVSYIPVTTGVLGSASTPLERKIKRQCDKFRICSPNYSNYFDFNAECNDGVTYFTADCEYKPYNPYIHINPNFRGLYGQDFNDPRGLILGGDFSLTQIIDKWRQYEIQNKNYELIFGRQIQSMEVSAKYGKQSDIVNAISGTVSAGTSGFMAGSMASGGNPLVGVIAGAGSALASVAGGTADVTINQALRDEAKDYAMDMFEYHKQNIQALPVTLSKVSSINPNNKIYPILEYYTCTDIEKEAFTNKLLYNGMTIDRIGKLVDYEVSDGDLHYYKAQLIRIDIPDDFHLTNAIARELNKGVFM